MTDLWYRKLGFYSNPYSIKPAAFQDELVAYDMPFIYSKIESAEMVFIEGQYGTGKTTILKNIIRQFKGKNKIIYYSFNSGEKDFHLDALLDGANTLLRKLSGIKVKNIIMLLDEVHSMKIADAKKLLKPFNNGTIQSVVFVSHDYALVNFPEEINDMLNGNILRTVNLSKKEAVDLIRKRIGNIELLSDTTISKIFSLSDKNPRRLLEHCEDVCRYAVEMGDEKVNDRHIKDVLGELKEEPKIKKEKSPEIKPVETKPKLEEKERTVVLKKPTILKPVQKAMPIQKPIIEEPILDPLEEIEIKEIPDKNKEKKFKINKLVTDEKKNTLGTISEKEPEAEKIEGGETPEYKVYFLDNE